MVYRLFRKVSADPIHDNSNGFSSEEMMKCQYGSHLFIPDTWYGPNAYCERCGMSMKKNKIKPHISLDIVDKE